jgi:uncharacterized protein
VRETAIWISEEFTSDVPISSEQRKPNFRGVLVMLLDELRAKKIDIAALCTQYGARRMRVFGSVARREERPDSDVDLLVDFPRGYDLFAQRLPLAERLSQLLNRRVELIPEHELNRHIRDRALSEAVDL